jgi:hypothetical protein
MRLRHGLPDSRQTLPQIGVDVSALVTVETKRLVMAIGAIASRFLRQQAVFPGEKRAVIACHAGSTMAIPAFLQCSVPVFPVVDSRVR